MRPHELCEPFFQYVCRLNRSARKGGIINEDQTRNEWLTLLADINTKSSSDGQLAAQFNKNQGKLSLVLMIFADHMIHNSKLSFAEDWADLAADEGITNGDEKFFEFLDETLKERSDAANERLAVYYICMGLGFTGSQAGQQQNLRKKMEETWSRLRGIWDAQPANRICPEAYENVNTTNLIEPPAASMVGIGIGLVGAIIVLFVANAFLYRSSSRDLQSAVSGVLQHTPPAPAAKSGAGSGCGEEVEIRVDLGSFGMERSADSNTILKISLLAIAALALLAFGYFVGNMQVLLIIIVGIAIVGFVLFLYRLILRRRTAKRAELATAEIAGATGKRPRELNDPAELAKIGDLSRKFEEGLEKFRTAGKDLYSIPWYVLVGEPGSGKTEALRHCGVPTPTGLAELPGVGGTINMNWWFTNQAIVLDTAGRLMFQSVEPGKSGEWNEFLKLLARARPSSPINGLLLVIPADSLIRDTNSRIEEKAKKIALQFDLIQRTLGVRFPVFVLITKADLINGFREFFDTLNDPNTQHQMVGWSNSMPLDAPFDPDQVDRHLETVRTRLLQYRSSLLLDPVNTDDATARRADQADALYAFPDALTSIAPRLRRYLELIFVQGEWSPKPLFLRGIYLTSAMREGSALDRELADVLGVPVDQLPEGKVWARERPQFLKELFTKKVFREKGLVTRATSAAGLQRNRQIALFGTGFAAIIALLVLTYLGSQQLKQNIVDQTNYWTALSKSYADPKTVVDSRKRLDDKQNWSVLGGAFSADGTELPNSFTTRGERKVSFGGKDRPLRDIHKEAAERVKGEIAVPAVFKPLAGFSGNLAEEDRYNAYRHMYEETVLKPVVKAAAAKMIAEKEWTEASAPSNTKALAELIRLEVAAATNAIPTSGAKGGGEGSASPLELDAVMQFVLTPESYKAFAANDAAPLQKSLDVLYDSTSWPPPAVRGIATGSINTGIDRFSAFWGTQASATGQRPGPAGDLRREALALEAALNELAALSKDNAGGPDSLTKYRELYADWKTKVAAATKARDAVQKVVSTIEQQEGGWPQNSTALDLYRSELAVGVTRAREAHGKLIVEIPENAPPTLLAMRKRLQQGIAALPNPKDVPVPDDVVEDLNRIQKGLLARGDASEPRLYQVYLKAIETADGVLPNPDATEAAASEDPADAVDAGAAGFVQRMDRLPTRLKKTDDSLNATLATVASSLPASAPEGTRIEEIRTTGTWIVKNMAGPYTRYKLLSAIVSGGGDAAVSIKDAKAIGEVVAASSKSGDAPVSDTFPAIPMTKRGATPSKYAAEYDRKAGPKVIQSWLNIRRVLGTSDKPRTDVLDIAELAKTYDETTGTSFGPYVGEYVKYWTDCLAEADDITAAKWPDFQKTLPNRAAAANEQLELLCKAVFDALSGLNKMQAAPADWKLQSRVAAGVTSVGDAFKTLELRTYRDECTLAVESWRAIGADPTAGIKAARQLGARKFSEKYVVSSTGVNPVTSYWKNLTYKGLELLSTSDAKGATLDLNAIQRFPLAPLKKGVESLSADQVRDTRDKITAALGPDPDESASSTEGLDPAYKKLYDAIGKKGIPGDEAWLKQARVMAEALADGGNKVSIYTVPRATQVKLAAKAKAAGTNYTLAGDKLYSMSVEDGEPAAVLSEESVALVKDRAVAGARGESFRFQFQRKPEPDQRDGRFLEPLSGAWAALKLLYEPYYAEPADTEGKVWHVQLQPKDFVDGGPKNFSVWVELRFDKPVQRFRPSPAAK